MVALAAASGIGGALSSQHPTANRASDVVCTAAFAALVALACSISRTWTWIVIAGAAATFSRGAQQAVGAAVEIAVIALSTRTLSQRRAVGAAIGAVSAQLLLRLGAGPFVASTALVAAAATSPALVSAWRVARSETRHVVKRAAYVLGGAVALATLAAAFSLVQARSSANRAIDQVRDGLDFARQGDTASAGKELAVAADSFSSARADTSSWWTRPAELIPIVGQQVASIDRLTGAGADAAAAASKATTEADVNDIRMRNGRIDVAKVEAAAQPLTEVKAALAEVQHAIGDARSPWLVPPLASRLDAVSAEIDRAASDADLASQAVAVAPSLLGAQTPRRYFVAFGNPAEPRDLGGFAGGYGELVIDGGKLELVRTGQASDLNAGGPHPLTDAAALPDRYRSLQLDKFWQNITGSPDFPTVAAAVEQLWPQSGGEPLDGVLYVDPYALSALLKLTGPVKLVDLPTPLTSANIVDFITRDQYSDVSRGSERHDLLSDAAKLVFDKLKTTELPGPRQLADALGPPAHDGRLLLHSFHPDEQALFERLGIDGALPATDGDFLAVSESDRGANKIGSLVARSTDDNVVFDPATGEVQATVRVTLRNDAPTSGLPDYVIGGTSGEPPGTYGVVLSVMTPLDLDSAAVDGNPVPIGAHHEYGHQTYSASMSVPSGASQTLELHLHGRVPPGSTYRLTAIPRSTVQDERLKVTVSATDGRRVHKAGGLAAHRGTAEIDENLVSRRDYWVEFT